MNKILGILFVLLMLAVAFSMWGCAAVLNPASLVTTVELAGDLAKKVEDLHQAGVDQRVLDDVRGAVADAHRIVDELHQKHVEGQQ